jgi:VWFA-related protein
MSSRLSRSQVVALGTIFISVALAAQSAWPQDQPRDKPQLKNFGTSLEQLKWDSERNEAVDTRPKVGRSEKLSDDDVVRVETTLVAADVLVLDARGQTVTGLTEKDFKITEDGSPQTVGAFALGDNSTIPRSIVLIIDYSSSQFPFIRTSIAAAKTMVDRLAPIDRMAIVTDDVELLQDFTNDKTKLKDSLDVLLNRATTPQLVGTGQAVRRKFGRSSQYSALMATLREAFDAEDQRPIVIFQTDGDEAYYLRNPIVGPEMPINYPANARKQLENAIERMRKEQRDKMRSFSLDDVYKAAERVRATIYTVVPGYRLVGLPPEQQAQQIKAEWSQRIEAWAGDASPESANRMRQQEKDRWINMSPETLKTVIDRETKVQSALAAVATLTGGWTAYLESPSQADDIYSRIFSDINRRYIVGYYPTNKAHDGKRRKVNVEVPGHPDYVVTGRKSYFAPGPEQ